jgi:hypothetical protein
MAIVIAGTIWFVIWIKGIQRDRDNYAKLYRTCLNAPADTVIIFDSIMVPRGVTFKPVPFKIDVHDTIFVPEKITWYDTVYREGKIKFKWMAQAHGSIDFIEFSDFVWPEKTVTITKKVDTCIAREPAYKAKFLHWGLYTEIQANNLKEFPGIGLGGQVVIKDRLTIGLGAVYADKFYGNMRIGVLLK